MTFDKILEIKPYSLNKVDKGNMLTQRLIELTEEHRSKCHEYAKMLNSIDYSVDSIKKYTELPFLPVRLFKELSLKSIANDDIVKTMTSSGTTGQAVSKIYLDKTTSSNQQKAMVKIVSDFTGSGRMPMIIIDCPSVIKDRNMFSARGAGILGFSIFGSKKIYALDDDMKLNFEEIKAFIEENKGKRILLFGFTFMIWKHFYKELQKLKDETGECIDLSNAVMIHGGGWKKLTSEAVSPEEFHDGLNNVCKIDSIHDYYGMVEQTGCIYMQCECGHLHASIFSDVIIRNPLDFSECEKGQKGIIQVVSTIPESYPGHSLLTEDEGIILGEDDCLCGRKGKYFKVLGRLKNAEIRGCSDTYASDYSRRSCNDSLDETVISQITFLVGNKEALTSSGSVAPLNAFDDKVIDFLGELSKELMGLKEAKIFADIAALGFWLRKSSLLKMKEKFEIRGNSLRIGRGVAFHIAPSNVPVNYAYSLFTGLLCGNVNVVRIPSKDYPQVSIINRTIDKVLNKYPYMKPYLCLIRYDRDTRINDYISDICDIRIIWGGDSTISELRRSAISPRATEITFADRYSLAVIDSEEYLMVENKERLALDFYNDTYLSDQNACTSPRVIAWIGNNKKDAKEMFWNELEKLVRERYSFQPIMSVDKLSQMYLGAASLKDIILRHDTCKDNSLVRISVNRLTPELMKYRGNCGFFYEYDCKSIMDLKEFCNNSHCQTIGVVKNKKIVIPLLQSGIKGVDRVSVIGHTMDFDLEWDGYNLVERLTRTISI